MGRLVTLTTDIGWAYAAQMKSVLASAQPPVAWADLAHDLPAHRIEEAAFLLLAMARGFPPRTVHVAVVDPGVGGRRAPIAVRCRDGSTLVGPDNGLLAPLAASLGLASVVELLPERVRPRATGSPTFDGRDLFAPAAARIANGTPLARLGRPSKLTPIRSPRASRTADHLLGEVVHIDRFGNLITSLPGSWCPPMGAVVTAALGRGARHSLTVVRTYEELAPRRAGLLVSSFDRLEIAVREGSAARRWRVPVGRSLSLGLPPGQSVNTHSRSMSLRPTSG